MKREFRKVFFTLYNVEQQKVHFSSSIKFNKTSQKIHYYLHTITHLLFPVTHPLSTCYREVTTPKNNFLYFLIVPPVLFLRILLYIFKIGIFPRARSVKLLSNTCKRNQNERSTNIKLVIPSPLSTPRFPPLSLPSPHRHICLNTLCHSRLVSHRLVFFY